MLLRKSLLALILLASTVFVTNAFALTPAQKKAILDIAADLAADKDVKAKVAALKKDGIGLDELMIAYKPKKGITVGAKEGGPGMEARINQLYEKGITKAALAKEKEDLIKMAYVNLAVAHVTKELPGKRGGKGAKEWNAHTEDMQKNTLDLIKALKGEDLGKIKSTAVNISNACNKCHSDFRD